MTKVDRSRPSDAEVLLCYALTSVAMASAWHLAAPSGIWWGNGIAVVVGLSSAAWIAGRQQRDLWRSWPHHLAYGVLLGVVIAALTQLVTRKLLLSIDPVRAEITRLYALLRSPPGPVRASPILLLVVLTEEFVFRGVVTTWLEYRALPARSRGDVPVSAVGVGSEPAPHQSRRIDATPPTRPRHWGTIVVASTLFYTLPLIGSGSPLLAAIGFGLGSIWTATRLFSGGLTVPLVSHVIFSFSTFVWLPIL
jgi:membrane protease YdiL (CAAX protease family)